MGTVFRKNGSWWINFMQAGERKRQKTNALSKEEAKKLLAAVMSDFERTEHGLPSKKKVRLKEVKEEFLKYQEGQGLRSMRWIRLCVKNLCDELGEVYLSHITTGRLEDYRKKRLSDGVAMATVNREMAVLKSVFNVARKQFKKYLGPNPVSDLKFYPEQPKMHYILTGEERAALLEAADPRLKPIILMALYTGRRISELLRLRWDKIDLADGTYRVEISKKKKREERVLPLSPKAVELLNELRRDKQSEWVFYNPKLRKPLKGVKSWFLQARDDAGLPAEFTFHDLRANFGTRLSERGVSISSICDLLCHASETTTRIYLNHTLKHQREQIRVIDEAYEEDKAPARHQAGTAESLSSSSRAN